jgi:hypothetical protein
MKPIKYGDTEQFRNVVKKVQQMSAYQGEDADGNTIYDYQQDKPTIEFDLSIKLHGTNASVVFTPDGKWYTQSRNGIFDPITHPDTHMGFTQFMLSKADDEIMEGLSCKRYNLIRIMVDSYLSSTNDKTSTVTVYGEWAGKGIQKGVGISEVDKAFYIFGVKITPVEEIESYWLTVEQLNEHFVTCERVRNLWNFPTHRITVDFNKPEIAQNEIFSIVQEVEAECPIARMLGVSGIGEGVVGVATYNGQRLIFKAKGDKHAKGSKVKVLTEVDTAEIAKQLEVANQVTPIWRLDQFYTEIAQEQGDEVVERKYIGEFINRVKNDIIKEDMDIVLDSGLDFKHVIKHLGDVCRGYFFNREKL